MTYRAPFSKDISSINHPINHPMLWLRTLCDCTMFISASSATSSECVFWWCCFTPAISMLMCEFLGESMILSMKLWRCFDECDSEKLAPDVFDQVEDTDLWFLATRFLACSCHFLKAASTLSEKIVGLILEPIWFQQSNLIRDWN